MKTARLIMIAVIVLLIQGFSRAQNFTWLTADTIAYTYNPDLLQYNTSTDQDGNLYFTGLKNLIQINGIDPLGNQFIKKYDDYGELLYFRLLEGQAAIKGIKPGPYGDLYIWGLTESDINFWGDTNLSYIPWNENYFVARIDSMAHITWLLNLNAESQDYLYMEAMEVDNADNVYIAYNTFNSTSIKKYSPEGNEAWTIEQQGTSLVSEILVMDDGSIYVAGSCAAHDAVYNGTVFGTDLIYNFYLVKYDADRQPLWVNYLSDITCQEPQLASDAYGNIYMSAGLYEQTQFGDITLNGPQWVFDFFIAKISPDGEYLWAKEIPYQEGISGDAKVGKVEFLALNAQDEIIFGGSTRGTIDWGNGVQSSVDLIQKMILLKYNSEGDVLWALTSGGDSYQALNSVSIAGPASIYATGVVRGNLVLGPIQYSQGQDDVAYPVLFRVLDAQTSIPSFEISSGPQVKVYPNPSSNILSLMAVSENLKKVDFFLADMSGRNFKKGSLDILLGSECNIDISDLVPGIYILRLRSDNFFQIYKIQII